MKRLLFVMSVALVLSGCATSKEELLPAGEQTMLELWQGKTTGGGQRHALAARETLRRPLTVTEQQGMNAEATATAGRRKAKSASSFRVCRIPTW